MCLGQILSVPLEKDFLIFFHGIPNIRQWNNKRWRSLFWQYPIEITFQWIFYFGIMFLKLFQKMLLPGLSRDMSWLSVPFTLAVGQTFPQKRQITHYLSWKIRTNNGSVFLQFFGKTELCGNLYMVHYAVLGLLHSIHMPSQNLAFWQALTRDGFLDQPLTCDATRTLDQGKNCDSACSSTCEISDEYIFSFRRISDVGIGTDVWSKSKGIFIFESRLSSQYWYWAKSILLHSMIVLHFKGPFACIR